MSDEHVIEPAWGDPSWHQPDANPELGAVIIFYPHARAESTGMSPRVSTDACRGTKLPCSSSKFWRVKINIYIDLPFPDLPFFGRMSGSGVS